MSGPWFTAACSALFSQHGPLPASGDAPLPRPGAETPSARLYSAMPARTPLTDLIATYPSMLIGYSGGVDSALLAVAARQVLGREQTVAALGISASYPRVQYEQAHAIAVFRKSSRADPHPDLATAALLHDVGKIMYPLTPWQRALIVLEAGRADRL